jgi:F0F1-type ATP synthase membrane subunit b/b'
MSRVGRALRVIVLVLCVLGFGAKLPVLSLAETSPAAKSAEGANETGVSHELIFDIINFILLAGVLVYLYRKRGRDFFDERSKSIRDNLEEGRRALESSRSQLAAAEEKLAHLKDEVSALKKIAEAEIVEEQKRLRDAAAEEARRIEEFAKVQIQAASNAAKLELKNYMIGQALDQAGNLVRQRLDERNRRRLVSFFLADIRSKMSRN